MSLAGIQSGGEDRIRHRRRPGVGTRRGVGVRQGGGARGPGEPHPQLNSRRRRPPWRRWGARRSWRPPTRGTLRRWTRRCTRTVAAFGRIDILFNNAGTNIRKNVVDMPDEDWHTIMDTNVKGAFLVARAVARQMVRQGSGTIINMSSMSAASAEPTKAVYSASKGAIALFTKGLALELAPTWHPRERHRAGVHADVARQGWLGRRPRAKEASPGPYSSRTARRPRGDRWCLGLPGLRRRTLYHGGHDRDRRGLDRLVARRCCSAGDRSL